MVKKVLMVIAPDNFRDEEFFEPKKVIEESGMKVIVANSTGKPSKSKFGKIIIPNKIIYNVKVTDYSAIVFVGGSGTHVYFNDKQVLDLVKGFFDSGKVIAAICIAPTILANAGVLNGKRATAYVSEKEKIESVGTYTGNDVERDGKIITAKWPTAANEFGRKIVEVI